MRRFLLALLLAAALRGDTPEELAAPPAPPAPAPAAAPGAHALTPDTSAKVVHRLPKYTPPPADRADRPAPDRREIDRPRNTIVRLPRSLLPPEPLTTRVAAGATTSEPAPDGVVRLPRYEVRDQKLPALKTRELLTPEAKIDLQFKKHPALRIGNIFGLNRGIAAAMAAEDEAYERRLELADLVSFQQWADQVSPPPAAAASPVSTGP